MSRCFVPVVFLAVFGSLLLQSTSAQAPKSAEQAKPARVDAFGDALPPGALARLGTARFRHGGLELAGFAADGKALLYFGNDAVHIWDIGGKRIQAVAFGDRSETVVSEATSGDGRVLAIFTATGDPTNRTNPTPIAARVMVFDTGTGKEITTVNISDVFDNVDWGSYLATYLAQLSLTEDGKQLLVRADVGIWKRRTSILLLDTKTGKRIHEMAPPQDWFFAHACFSHNGKHILALEQESGVRPARIRVLDLQGAEMRTVVLPAGVSFFNFEPLPDGKTLLATKLEEGVASLYDFSTGKELRRMHSFSGKKGSLSRDGRHVFTPETDKVQMWDAETGVKLQHFDKPGMTDNARWYSLAVSPDGKRLAVSGDRTFKTFDVVTGKQLTGTIEGSGILGLRFTPDGQDLLVRNRRFDLQQWHVKTATQVRTFEPSPVGVNQDLPRLLYFSSGIPAFSGDGKLVAMMETSRIEEMETSKVVGLWEAATGKFKNALGGDHVSCFAFAPKKSILAIGDEDGTLTLWDPATRKSVRKWKWVEFTGDEDWMRCMAFSPDGKTLAACMSVQSQGTTPHRDQNTHTSQVWIVQWETETGKERSRVQCSFGKSIIPNRESWEYTNWRWQHLALSISFSPDGQKVVLNSWSAVHVLDAFTGKHLVSHSGWMMFGRTAVFSRDGKFLFFGSLDGSVRVMDIATGRVIREVPAHEARVDALALSPDGKLLASGSADSTVLLWDVAALAEPAAAVNGIADPKNMQKLWNDLADIDAVKAFAAMNALASAAADAAPFFKACLKAVPPVDPMIIEKLLDDLNSEKFAVRDKATKELEKLGDLAGPKLAERLAAQPPLEVRQRIERLLGKLADAVLPVETLQTLRAIEVLERIRTAPAREVLAALAKGAPGHRITEEARDAVERVDSSPGRSPARIP